MIRRIFPVIAAIVLAAPPAYSEEGKSGQCTDVGDSNCQPSYMEEVVVTGTRTSKKILNSPLSLSLINSQQLLNSTADGVAEILRDLPGISVSDSGQAGLKRIRIRGEESRRVAVLIDGQESTDHREVGVPLLLDPQLVERIEVVRGPVSVLYGAKALGGVVNIITKKGGDRPLQGYVSGSYNSANGGLNSAASVFGRAGEYGYRISLADNDQGERRTPAGRIENTRYDSDSIGINVSRSAGNHHVELSYDEYRSAAEVYVEPVIRFTPPFLDFAIDAPKRDRKKSALFYSVETSGGLLRRVAANAYRQISDRQFNTFPSMLLSVPPPGMQIDSSIYTDSLLTTDGALLQLDWLPNWKHDLITGIQFNYDDMAQTRHKETRVNLGAPGFEDIADSASIATTAIFVQDDWQVSEAWSVVTGLRNYWVKGSLDQTDRPDLERGNLDDNHLIGSASLLYAGMEDTVLRATVSQGYVYPSLLQVNIPRPSRGLYV
jgi:hemoglobin/transferrin/lactoferrin receptor protein|tara:strand:- start:4 stop:1476 length:1473 start_codon:yes stop_codon:yes gene_type:complete